MKSGIIRKFTIAISMLLAAALLLLSIPMKAIAAPTTERRKIVNVVFVIDSTGSMSEEIGNVKTNLTSFSQYLKSRPGLDELRLGLVDYKDITEGEPTAVYKSSVGSPWFENVDELIGSFDKINVSGGGDSDETPFDGLGYLVCGPTNPDALLFNSDAYKFAFLLTDAGYKTNNNFGISGMSSMVDKLKESGIYTSVVCPSSERSTYSSLYGYAPDGAVRDEDGQPFTGEWMDIYGDFARNMQDFADRILDVVRPELMELTLEVGAKFNFRSFANIALEHPEKAQYSTSNDAIVSLNPDNPNIGTAEQTGKCVITITDGETVLQVEVTVQEGEIEVPVKELKISTEVIVGVDQSVYVKAVALPEEASERGLIWFVGDSSVIEIVSSDENLCYLKGLQSGTTTLTALTKDGGYSGSTTITVTLEKITPVMGVELSMSSCTLQIGETMTATGKVLPEDATNRGGYWYSSDSDIVRIVSSDDGSCTFEAVSCGNARVYFVSNEGGFSKAIEVTVPHHASWLETRKPTCGVDGERLYICDSCDSILETETIPATGEHVFNSWEPAVTEDEVLKQVKRTCSVCGLDADVRNVGVRFYTEKAQGKYPDTIEMKIRLAADSFLTDLQMTFDFDTEYFDVTEASISETLGAGVKNVSVDEGAGQLRFLYSGTGNLTEDTVFATVVLKIKKNVAYKVVNALTVHGEAYNICHAMLDGTIYSLDYSFDGSFGEVSLFGPDPNGDGELNIFDLYLMLSELQAGDYDPHDPELVELMDCNGDGIFDIADITYLQYIIAYMD